MLYLKYIVYCAPNFVIYELLKYEPVFHVHVGFRYSNKTIPRCFFQISLSNPNAYSTIPLQRNTIMVIQFFKDFVRKNRIAKERSLKLIERERKDTATGKHILRSRK